MDEGKDIQPSDDAPAADSNAEAAEEAPAEDLAGAHESTTDEPADVEDVTTEASTGSEDVGTSAAESDSAGAAEAGEQTMQEDIGEAESSAEPGEPDAAEQEAPMGAGEGDGAGAPEVVEETPSEPVAADDQPAEEVAPEPVASEAEGAEDLELPSTESEEEEPDAGEDEPADESTMSDMERLLEEGDYLPEQVNRGDLVKGTVVRKDEDQLILDIGAKQQGVVPHGDLLRMPRDYLDGINVGDLLDVVVLRPDWREGEVLVSVYQAQTMADWEKAQENLESGEILELDVVGYNKGGVLVQYGHLQGFVPRSHLAGLGAPTEGEGGSDALEQVLGQGIPVKVIEVHRRRRRLIMSHRQALHQWRSERKKSLIDELSEGEVRSGRVSSVADFGAFVDLGGADGLVHVSELTYERGKHPRDIVKVGQEVEVYVLSVDRKRRRIGLSIKRLQSDPWATVEQDHYVGELVEASVSNLTKFGAFARLEDGLEGLIHISELSDRHVDHPREVLKPGQGVTVEVISIDANRQRIGLSIRRVPEHLRAPEGVEEPEPDAAAPEEAAAEGAPEEAPAVEAVDAPSGPEEAEGSAAETATEAEDEGEAEAKAEEEAEAEVEAEEEAEPEEEAAAEAAAQAEEEAEAEVEAEEEAEPEAEAEEEAEAEAAAQAEEEAEPEAEAAAQAEEETEAEAEIEEEAEAEAEAEEEAGPEEEAEPEAEAEEEAAAEAEEEAEAEAEVEEEAEPEAEAAAEAEEEAEPEVEAEEEAEEEPEPDKE